MNAFMIEFGRRIGGASNPTESEPQPGVSASKNLAEGFEALRIEESHHNSSQRLYVKEPLSLASETPRRTNPCTITFFSRTKHAVHDSLKGLPTHAGTFRRPKNRDVGPRCAPKGYSAGATYEREYAQKNKQCANPHSGE